VVILGWFYNVFYETLVLLAMQFVYNDLRWCDGHWLIRNALISIGYGLYSAISILIIIGPGNTLNTKGIQWIFIIVLVMLSTQHICDIKDVAGDRLKGRQTVPIIFGDHYCRKSIELSVYACSIICLAFFDSAFWSSAMTMSMARMIAYRLMNFRSLGDDKLTWKLWALWTVNLFVLPLTRSW
jgi:4-hydroxybenzoate polyprenyltransferase